MPHPDAYVARIRALMDAHGWAVQAVGGAPPFAYTIGLSRRGAPEYLAVGLRLDVAHRLLNDLARATLDGSLQPGSGSEVFGGDLAGDFSPHVFRLVDVDRVYRTDRFHLFNVARAVLNAPLRRVVQVVWPDPQGSYPGDPSYEATTPQPVFDRPGVGGFENDRGGR